MAIARLTGAFIAVGAGACLLLAPGPALGASGVHAPAVTWSIAPVPAPDGTPTLNGDAPQLSCTSATFCAMMPNSGYLTTLSKGVASTVVAPHSPDPYSNDSLMSIACIHAGSCIAIGSTAEGPWDPLHVYREVLSHGTWTASNGGSQAFQQIACGTMNCVAIANVFDQGPFLARLDDEVTGRQWGTGTLTVPFRQSSRPPDVSLSSATCSPAGGCVALGYADGKNIQMRPVLFYHQDDLWKGFAEVFPPGADPNVDAGTSGAESGMSCVSTYNCIGLGEYRDRATGHAQLFAEILTDGVLSAHALVLPGGPNTAAALSAGRLDCASMTDCAGSASWQGPGNRTHAVLVRLHGGTWSVEPAPRPAATIADSSVTINDTACAIASTCIAVGSYPAEVNGEIRSRPAQWIWNTDGWVPQAIRSGLRAANQSLTSIQCPSASMCTAAGVFDGRPVYGRGSFG